MGKLIITDNKKDTFDFKPSGNPQGGTELQMKWLRENVDSDLLDSVDLIPSRVGDMIDDGRKKVLWLHDTPDDPESAHMKDPKSRARFERFVYVSNWQKQWYELMHNIAPSEGVVIKNAIYPIPEHTKPDDGIVRLIYHTTPHRGLALLAAAFNELCNHHENIHLDVFSSFSLYGWDHRDEEFRETLNFCNDHPQITYHGAKSNDEVRKALEKADIFAYPSIWPETSCISAIEAMSAGCLVVCPNLAALPETTANFAWMYNYHENPQSHANMFVNILNDAIIHVKSESVQNSLKFQKMYTDNFYSWNIRAQEWTGFLNSINNG